MHSLLLKTLGLSLVAAAALFATPEADASPRSGGGEWVHCANEDGYCSVNGRAEVAYGAGQSFVYRTMSGSFRCSNDVFGDPAYKVKKACYVILSRGGYEEDRGRGHYDRDDRGGRRRDRGGYDRGGRHDRGGYDRGGAWQFCAKENRTCYVGGRAEVRYGANGRYYTMTANGSIQCDNRTFGDPAVGTTKSCEFRLR